jgi:tetratricopeptide (TPR) repeat protein
VLEPAVVEAEGKPRGMMESAIELDDDALLEYEEEAEAVPPPAPKSATQIRASVAPRPEAPAPGLRGHDDALVAELARRADAIGGDAEPVARSRARMELGLVLEALVGDREAALQQYRAAQEAAPSATAPLTAARWLTPQRPVGAALSLALSHARAARDDEARVERWVEVARLHQVAGDLTAADKAYGQALALEPTHPASLRGREGLLHAMARSDARGTLAPLSAHLETMASAWSEAQPLSAWLHVERAAALDRLGRGDAARVALESAMDADGRAPSVRAAYTRHLLVHRATEALVNAWSEHARDDRDRARAARFEFVAGRLASERLDDLNLAVTLHARASERGDADVDVRRDALLELARLHAALGNPRASTDARERYLALIDEPRRRAHEHRKLSETFELLGHHEDVVRHTNELLRSEPDDAEARDRLDRSLEALGRHDERIAVWTDEAARGGAPASRSDCYVRAARIAESDLHDPARGESLFRAGWAADNRSFHAFEGLSRLLARPATAPGQVVPEHARARIDLYEQAALAASDLERRLAYLEKVAQIWEDELNQPMRAIDA